MKRAMKPSVGKLLRVLVAGGVALAGTASPLAALAAEAPDQPGTTAAEKPVAAKKPADAPASRKKAATTEKAKEPEKKAAEAGGVKGW
jgi:cell division septation protein DedD